MISKIVSNIIERLKDTSISFKERVFILLTLITDAVAILALIGDIVFGESLVEILALAFCIIAVPIVTIVSIKYNKVNLAMRFVVITVAFGLLPLLFFFGGGFKGGGVVWIVFAYLYSGLVLTGIWRPIMFGALTIESLLFYMVSRFYPDLVATHSDRLFYRDTVLSIILVGLVCSFMVMFEEWMYGMENKRAREETKKVEELNRSQNRFFSSMSHEIRTPINSILGLNEIILRQEDASEEILNDASNIQGAGKMLLSLINDILDMSKIEAGKMDIVPINYNLASMLSEIVNMMWLRAQQKGLELKIEVDPAIPSELFGDEVRIKQILVNLLNNAVKYTREGSVTLRIEKEELRGDGVLLLFSVIDTGMGIKQDVIPFLFDAFQRVDEEKNAKIEGSGLGLAIVKQLVDLMDGKITVSSVYTEGTTFIVTLWQRVTRRDPIGDVNIRDFGKRSSGKKYEPGFTAPDARILIVDDNEMNLEVEKKLLDGTQMSIDTAFSGREALFMTTSERYDVILMDHLMPEMDGVECMQSIRKQAGGFNNHTPIIVLTANADSENRDLYNRSGFDGYLVKPVSGAQLEEILLDHLPEVKVKRTEGTELSKVQLSTKRGYSKKIPVLIAAGSMCDLPAAVLKANQIDIIPFSIISEGRIYYDILEASPDEVMRYVAEGASYDSEPPSVEEFERFFAKEVKKAHQIIYITVSSDISGEYNNATEAARGFGNVKVVDSRANATALGFLVLLAQRMAMQGRNFERILDELEWIKDYIHCSFITGDPENVMRRAGFSRAAYSIFGTFGFKPVIHIRKGKIIPARMYAGDFLSCYKRYIDYALPKSCDPDLDVIVVDYVTLSQGDKVAIEDYLRKKFNFDHVIFQQVSSVMALNCGRGAMGITYLLKRDQPYSLSQMFSSILEIPEDEIESPVERTMSPTEFRESFEEYVAHDDEKDEKKWYESIPGIDGKKAIENSGSEESFKSVLKIFYDSIDLRSGEIEEYYNNEDWENYTVKVHALKSSARLIGAIPLSEDALELEKAGKEGNIGIIREKTDKLLSDFRSYKDMLHNACECPGGGAEQEMDDKTKELLESLYEAIREACDEKDDLAIEEVLNEIMSFDIPAKHMENLDKIRDLFELKDYDSMKQLSKL